MFDDQELVKANKLDADRDQRQLAQRLNEIESQLLKYQPFWKQNISQVKYESLAPETPKELKKQEKKSKFFSFLSATADEEGETSVAAFKPKIQKPEKVSFHVSETPFRPNNVPRGIYTHGSSGTGKTLITAKFFEELPVEFKLQSHFFEFMDRVHRSNFEQTKVQLSERTLGRLV